MKQFSSIIGCAITLAIALAFQPWAMPQSMGTQSHHPHFQLLYSFQDSTDGATPVAGVIRDDEGNLYGTAKYGGDLSCGLFGSGCGVVFKVSKAGKETTLYTFLGGTDGAFPSANLIQDAAGSLYGTTYGGGQTNGCGGSCGTIFKLDTKGKETVLYRFKGGSDGSGPVAGLLQDASGNLYGTTDQGGGSGCFENQGCGTVFELDTNGKEHVLCRFKGGSDGQRPDAGVIEDAEGDLYGTTLAGGNSSCNDNDGCGTVFELNPKGKKTILHTFSEAEGGDLGGLILDGVGNLYGVAVTWGPSLWGTIFEIPKSGGQLTLVYSFTGKADGGSPTSIIRDAAGNFYGGEDVGGMSCGFATTCGRVFELDTAGRYAVLHNFIGGDGEFPNGGLIRDGAGNLYGTTLAGGAANAGVVFEVSP
jgi:uncharacterized repeat protein (TIGR03803 family)